MGRFFKAFKAGVDAMGKGPEGERFTVVEKPVSCCHCSHDHFVEGRAQLNTAGRPDLPQPRLGKPLRGHADVHAVRPHRVVRRAATERGLRSRHDRPCPSVFCFER